MKPRRYLVLLIVFITASIFILSISVSSLSFGYKWTNTPRTVYFSSNMDSIGRSEIQKAMTKWNQVKVKNLSPVYMILSSSSQQNSIDYQNSFQSYVAYCNISHSTTEIFSVNIDLNTYYYNFSQGAVAGCYDVQSIVLHELGHGLGIRHCHEAGDSDPCWSPTCNANVMYRLVYTNTTKRSFQPYDTASYQSIYWNDY
jgi:hypothetical protein